MAVLMMTKDQRFASYRQTTKA